MKKLFSGALAMLTVIASVSPSVPANAQDRRDDSDRAQRGNRGDNARRDWRNQRQDNGRRGWSDNRGGSSQYRWQNYGGRYGYSDYRGHWRTGQQFAHWNDNGDIVMAAVASGVIGLILGSQIGNR